MATLSRRVRVIYTHLCSCAATTVAVADVSYHNFIFRYRFVSVSKEQEGEDDADLMFALTVTDDQDTLQLLFSGAEAERFLNITSAADLLANPALRQQVHDQLQTCRDLKLVCDYKIKVFVHREKVVLGGGGGSVGPGAAKRGGKSMGNRRKEPVENCYTR